PLVGLRRHQGREILGGCQPPHALGHRQIYRAGWIGTSAVVARSQDRQRLGHWDQSGLRREQPLVEGPRLGPRRVPRCLQGDKRLEIPGGLPPFDKYLTENLPEDFVPWTDFDNQAVIWRYRDTSAASLCAYGLLRMSELDPDRELANRDRKFAIRILNSLVDH